MNIFYMISFTMASLNGDKIVRSGFMIGKLITITGDAAKILYQRQMCIIADKIRN